MCGRLDNLGRLGVVQVPKLDVAVAGGNKVGVVIRKGNSGHLTGHLIGCDHNVFLTDRKKQDVKSIQETADWSVLLA